jgi:hypothetical protein
MYSALLGGEAQVAIFLFHGVIREPRHQVRNYTHKHLTLDRFVAVLQDLCASGAPVSMPEVVAAHVHRLSLPARAFVITFDDGFENNYSVAAPVLDDLKIPATFYVTTGFIESNTSSWIDMIEYAVEKTPRFELQLRWPELSGAYETREQKLGLLHQIRQVVKNDSSIEPYDFAKEIWQQLGVHEMEPDPQLAAGAGAQPPSVVHHRRPQPHPSHLGIFGSAGAGARGGHQHGEIADEPRCCHRALFLSRRLGKLLFRSGD